MIKGILFDYGGVVGEGGRGVELTERLCTILGLPESKASELIMALFGKLARGTIDEETFWSEIESEANISITAGQRHAWDGWWSFQPYPEMLAIINKLHAASLPVGLLSNIIPPTRDKIAAAGSYDTFDFIVLSCDVGFAKPDPEIYDLALAKFKGLKPEEIVFIDDQEKCMPPAKALGMQTILATSTDQIVDEMRRLDLPV